MNKLKESANAAQSGANNDLISPKSNRAHVVYRASADHYHLVARRDSVASVFRYLARVFRTTSLLAKPLEYLVSKIAGAVLRLLCGLWRRVAVRFPNMAARLEALCKAIAAPIFTDSDGVEKVTAERVDPDAPLPPSDADLEAAEATEAEQGRRQRSGNA